MCFRNSSIISNLTQIYKVIHKLVLHMYIYKMTQANFVKLKPAPNNYVCK